MLEYIKKNRALQYSILLLIFGLGIYLRLHVPDLARPIIVGGDESSWSNSAKVLLKYGTLMNDRSGAVYRGEQLPQPGTLPTPGYPLYLAGIYKVFGDSDKAVYISQIVLSLVALFLIYRMMLLLNIHPAARLIALLGAALYPGFYYNLDRVLTEQLFMTVFLLFSYFLIKGAQKDSAVLVGWSAFFLAASTYVKTQALPFVCLALFVLIVYKTAGRRLFSRIVLVFIAVFALSMAPWMIRNYLAFGKINIFTENGLGPMIWGAVPYFNDMAATAGLSLSEILKENIAADPAVFYQWRIFGFLQYMWGDLWDEHLVHPGRYIQPFIILQMFVLVPTLIALPLLVWKKRIDWLVVASIPLAFTLIHMFYHGLPRYVQGSVPFVFICLGMLITLAIDRSRGDQREFAIGASIAGVVNRPQKIADLIMRSSFMIVAVLFSVALFYSIYLFRTSISEQVSAYRLGKYAATTISAVERSPVVFSKAYRPEELVIENSIPKKDSVSRFTNDRMGPSLIKVVIPAIPMDGLAPNEKIVSKVTLNIRGGNIYDYSTVYWASPEKPAMSEDAVYSLPISPWQKTKTVYMPSDVTGLLVVPVVFRGGYFVVRSIEVTKYRITRD